MTRPTIEELEARIRRGLDYGLGLRHKTRIEMEYGEMNVWEHDVHDPEGCVRCETEAAITDLAARAREAEGLLRSADAALEAVGGRVEMLEATLRLARTLHDTLTEWVERAQKAERERDEAREAHRLINLGWNDAMHRAQKAERDLATAREALRTYFAAKDDKSWGPKKDWHKRHDESKAEAALREVLRSLEEKA